jgi:hypothetical protein
MLCHVVVVVLVVGVVVGMLLLGVVVIVGEPSQYCRSHIPL